MRFVAAACVAVVASKVVIAILAVAYHAMC